MGITSSKLKGTSTGIASQNKRNSKHNSAQRHVDILVAAEEGRLGELKGIQQALDELQRMRPKVSDLDKTHFLSVAAFAVNLTAGAMMGNPDPTVQIAVSAVTFTVTNLMQGLELYNRAQEIKQRRYQLIEALPTDNLFRITTKYPPLQDYTGAIIFTAIQLKEILTAGYGVEIIIGENGKPCAISPDLVYWSNMSAGSLGMTVSTALFAGLTCQFLKVPAPANQFDAAYWAQVNIPMMFTNVPWPTVCTKLFEAWAKQEHELLVITDQLIRHLYNKPSLLATIPDELVQFMNLYLSKEDATYNLSMIRACAEREQRIIKNQKDKEIAQLKDELNAKQKAIEDLEANKTIEVLMRVNRTRGALLTSYSLYAEQKRIEAEAVTVIKAPAIVPSLMAT